jgi:group I intron endonuclease
MTIGIYKITNTINEKFYIGSSNNVEKRWASHRYHLRHNKHHAEHLNRAWNKYGERSFVFEILEETSEDLLLEVEQKYLDNDRPWDPNNGYNSCQYAGRSTGRRHSEETKKLIGETHRGKAVTQESRERMRQSALKKPKISEETRKKMSKARKGQVPWNKGVKQTDETKNKISKAMKGKESGSKGYRWTEIQRTKLKEIRKSGTESPRARFNKQEVIQIRRMFVEENKTQTALSKIFKCSRGAIKNALLRYEDVLELREKVNNKYYNMENK